MASLGAQALGSGLGRRHRPFHQLQHSWPRYQNAHESDRPGNRVPTNHRGNQVLVDPDGQRGQRDRHDEADDRGHVKGECNTSKPGRRLEAGGGFRHVRTYKCLETE